MKKYLLIAAGAFLTIQLTGCATHNTTQSPAPIIEKTTPAPVPEVAHPEAPAQPTLPPAVPSTRPTAPAPANNAVTSLASQARAQYQAKNYQGAIATAERGLRIDRRSAELYLILAQSYVQLANTQLAQQFVQQGIRYAQAGSEVAQSLSQVRESLGH